MQACDFKFSAGATETPPKLLALPFESEINEPVSFLVVAADSASAKTLFHLESNLKLTVTATIFLRLTSRFLTPQTPR